MARSEILFLKSDYRLKKEAITASGEKESRKIKLLPLLYRALLLAVLVGVLVGPTCRRSPQAPRVVYRDRSAAEPLDPPRITPLDPNMPNLSFLVLGDWGTGYEGQRQVAEGMAGVVARPDRGAHFVVGVGDNFYPGGIEGIDDPQWQSKFEQVYDAKRFPMPFYMTLGNHDYDKNPLAQVRYHGRGTGRWQMEARYYSFTQNLERVTQVQFFALDTQMLIKGDQEEVNRQLAWLDSTLAASRARWKIVFGHHPLFSNGQHGRFKLSVKPYAMLVSLLEKYRTRKLRSMLAPRFEKYGVDTYFCGHDHDLQALQPRQGVHYFVSGAGAAVRSVVWDQDTLFAAAQLGFIWCRITRQTFLVVFYNAQGEALWALSFGH